MASAEVCCRAGVATEDAKPVWVLAFCAFRYSPVTLAATDG